MSVRSWGAPALARAAVLGLCTSMSALAADLTVQPGDDVGSLLSSLSPGSTITFADGVYDIPEQINLTSPGTEAEPIVLQAAAGASPVLVLQTPNRRVINVDGGDYVEIRGLVLEGAESLYTGEEWYGAIRVANSSHVTLENLTLRKLRSHGVALEGDNQAIVIRDNEFADLADGSAVSSGCWDASCWTQDATVTGNWIHDLTDDDSAIVFYAGAQNNTIADNVLHGLGASGIVTYSTEYGEPNVIEGNIIWNASRHGLYVAGSARVRNNVVFDVDGHGLYSENNRESLENLVISHNTFVNTTDWAVRLRGWPGLDGMVFANNAIANPTGRSLRIDEGELDEAIFVSGNVITGYVEGLDPERGHYLPGGGFLDYENVENWDFYPHAVSSLRDVGDPSSEAWVPTVDFNGLERNGEVPDVGAYEWVQDGNPGWTVREDFKAFEDNRVLEQVSSGCCAKDEAAEGDQALLLLPLIGLLGLRRRRP